MNEIVIPSYSFLRVEPKKSLSVILLIIIIFIIYSLNQRVTTISEVQAIVFDNNLHLLIPHDEVKNIIDKDELLIENKKYKYKIKNILPEIQVINNQNIQEIEIDIKLPKKYQLNNLILTTKIIKSEKTLFKKLNNILVEREDK